MRVYVRGAPVKKKTKIINENNNVEDGRVSFSLCLFIFLSLGLFNVYS